RLLPADARLLHLRHPGDADRLRPHPRAAGPARPGPGPDLGGLARPARGGPGLGRRRAALARRSPSIHRSRWMSTIPTPDPSPSPDGPAAPAAVELAGLRRDYPVRSAAPGSRRRRRRVVRAVDDIS